MYRFRFACALLFAGLIVSAWASTAHATVLNPGNTLAPSATTQAILYPLGGEDFGYDTLESVVRTFTGGLITGSVDLLVRRNLTTSYIDFLYRIHNTTSSGLEEINRLTSFNFTGWSTDAMYISAGDSIYGGDPACPGTNLGCNSVTPLSADRSASGSTVGFDDFTNPSNASVGILPGESSLFMVIRTNAPDYNVGTVSIINGGSDNVSGFAPAPEPGSLLLLGTGLLGCASLARRRFAARK